MTPVPLVAVKSPLTVILGDLSQEINNVPLRVRLLQTISLLTS